MNLFNTIMYLLHSYFVRGDFYSYLLYTYFSRQNGDPLGSPFSNRVSDIFLEVKGKNIRKISSSNDRNSLNIT